jgi:hypothetical protein
VCTLVDPVIFLTAVPTPVKCFGGNDGSINLTATGGNGGFTYLWSNGFTGEDPSGLHCGYLLRNGNRCKRLYKINLCNRNATNSLAVTGTTSNVSCNGGSNGSINLTVSGGTPGYTFNWSNGTTTEDLNGLTIGTYTVTVTDANGCTKTASFTITQPTALVVNILTVNPACFGQTMAASRSQVQPAVHQLTLTCGQWYNPAELVERRWQAPTA